MCLPPDEGNVFGAARSLVRGSPLALKDVLESADGSTENDLPTAVERLPAGASPLASVSIPALQETVEEIQRALPGTVTLYPPKPRELDPLLPKRVWSPTYLGCQSVVAESRERCPTYLPDQRLYYTDMNALLEKRKLRQGVENIPEPLSSRQAHIQFLMMDISSGKDPYTGRSLANSVEGGTFCANQKANPTEYVWI